MDRAPLRPVPGRPAEPPSDAAAAALVAAALPSLGERERAALALGALAGRPRAQVALRLGIDAGELPAVLARARKELRRSVAPLPGSGWCERAELLISERMDGALSERDAPRLDVHLRNCPRCVEHERRLVQATDGLIAGALPSPAAAPAAPAPPAVVSLVLPERDGEPATLPVARVLRELAVAVGWSVVVALAVAAALGAIVLGAAIVGLQL